MIALNYLEKLSASGNSVRGKRNIETPLLRQALCDHSFAMRYAPCAMPSAIFFCHALCVLLFPVPYALCSLRYAPCALRSSFPCALCPMLYALCAMRHALCVLLFPVPYALCSLRYAPCALRFAIYPANSSTITVTRLTFLHGPYYTSNISCLNN